MEISAAVMMLQKNTMILSELELWKFTLIIKMPLMALLQARPVIPADGSKISYETT